MATRRAGGRPSREAEVDWVCELAGARPESVRNFFNRPGRLSPEMRQRIAAAVAQTGYHPSRKATGALAGVAVGYQLPRSWTRGSTVMTIQLHELVSAIQLRGGLLVPFVVDPTVPGVADVTGGTAEEQADPVLGLHGWHREYANALAPSVYRKVMRDHSVQAFVVNDLFVDDPRLAMLSAEGILHVALGLPRSTISGLGAAHPYVETDNRRAIGAMVAMLRAAGCKTFGHVGFADDDSHVPYDRREAVLDAVGHVVPLLTISYFDSVKSHDMGHGRRIRDWLIEHDVDAVICDSDALAYMVHSAAKSAGRSAYQDPKLLRAKKERTLMLTGNDNSLERNAVMPAERWMTLEPPEKEKMTAVADMLAHLRSGDPTPMSGLVSPSIIGWASDEHHPMI